MEYLQAVLKEFDSIATFIDKILIQYFRDDMRLSIRAQLDKKDCNLENW